VAFPAEVLKQDVILVIYPLLQPHRYLLRDLFRY
jgi:hypothetical protein